MASNTLIQPIFLSFAAGPVSANLHVCYLIPSSTYFALVFISPTLLHHIILVLSLYASWKHLGVERTTGSSVMQIVRRDQLLYVLAICLVNFANVVLVLQQTHSEYKLINFFPATCLTQMFLGRLFFSLRAYSTRPRPHSFALPTRALHEPIDHTSPHDPSLPFQPEKASLVGPASLTTWDQKESSRPSPETSLDSISTLVHRSPFNEDSPPSPPPPSNHSPHVGSHHSPHGRSSSVDSSRRRERFFSVRLGTRKAREGMGGREKGGGGSE